MHARCKADKEGEKVDVAEEGKAGASADERGGNGKERERGGGLKGILGTGNFWQVGPRQPSQRRRRGRWV